MYSRIASRLRGNETRVRTTLPSIWPFSTCFQSERKMATLAYEDIVVKPSEEEEAATSNVSRSFRAIILHGLMGSGRNWRNFSHQLGSATLQRNSRGSAEQLWVLDSVPGEVVTDDSDGEVEKVLSTLKFIPNPIPSRRWLVDYMRNLGFSKTLSDWLGSNLKRVDTSSEEVTWVFDLNGIVEMFNSYRKKSYWSLLQHPPQGLEISIVRAENSDRWNSAVLAQLESVANKEQSAENGKVFYHVLKNAGHWVHIDNPKGLIDIMAPSLARLTSS